jgi:hypothetical protein
MPNASYSLFEAFPDLEFLFGKEKLSTPYIIAAVLVNLPITLIILNALWQLVNQAS